MSYVSLNEVYEYLRSEIPQHSFCVECNLWHHRHFDGTTSREHTVTLSVHVNGRIERTEVPVGMAMQAAQVLVAQIKGDATESPLVTVLNEEVEHAT